MALTRRWLSGHQKDWSTEGLLLWLDSAEMALTRRRLLGHHKQTRSLPLAGTHFSQPITFKIVIAGF